MSYCRFSSDDFQCDVYCYEDRAGGFTTHVAGSRLVIDGNLPPPVPFDRDNIEGFVQRTIDLGRWVETAKRVNIGLPYDGVSFNDPDERSAADRLIMLREAGYNVPQYAIDALIDEIED